MKPINLQELNRSYFKFIIHFVILILFVLMGVACFFFTGRHELRLLGEQSRTYDQLTYYREEVTSRFDNVLLKLRSLSQYVNADAQELSNQALLINGVQSDNNRVRGLLDERRQLTVAPSYELYGKMTRNVMVLASLKDSLSQTRFQMESLREQLEACDHSTKKAMKKLNGY
ncbi:type VI secretion system TssO [Chitinophaga sp. CB10]|uniref:type VI secretion system TssO n=1 Tax=Chitinophaga sp. CB10 TaxID=1891659 RepID=UPI0025BB21CC|nr:type VI secretion system TssO [Chitinophaga sp. CB10]